MPPAVCLRTRTRYRHDEPPMTTFISGEDIEAGMSVAMSKASRDVIIKADCSDPARMPCVGCLYERRLIGQEAEVIHFGLGVNLKRIEDFDNGHYIYPSTTPGYFTKNQPSEGEVQICGMARDACSAVLFGLPALTQLGEGFATLGNHTITPGDTTDEVFFAGAGDPDEYDCPKNGILYVDLDMTEILADDPITVTGRLYHMVDGATPTQIGENWWNSTHDRVPTLHLQGEVTVGATIQLSLQCSGAVGGDRTVNHIFVMEQ